MERIRLLIAGLNRLFRESLAHFLNSRPDMAVVGKTESAAETLETAQALEPGIIILDTRLPDTGGIEAARQLIALQGNIKIIALSESSAPHYAWRMINMGVSGYLLTSAPLGELVKTIRSVARGELRLSPEIAGIVVKTMAERPFPDKAAGKLSGREREVLQLIAEGYKPGQIAKKLYISPKTVQIHQASLKKKLNLTTTAALTKYAVSKGITPLEIIPPRFPEPQ
ncbi:MAG: response regulator transcription factor [Desulfobacter sp.]|nr:MAG: response regulator transcription factor [Desulfobacter sp.]